MRQPVGMDMVFARLVYYVRIKWFKPSDPMRYYAFQPRKISEPD